MSDGIAVTITILGIFAFFVGMICVISTITEIDDIYFLDDYKIDFFGNKVRRTKQEKIKEFFWPFLYTILLNDYLKTCKVNIIGRILVMIIVVTFALPVTILFFIIWLTVLVAVRIFRFLFVKKEKEKKNNYKIRGKDTEKTNSNISNNVIDAEYRESYKKLR